MCSSSFFIAFLIIVLTLGPETLITATPDVPCAEDWAAIVPESLWILVFTIFFYFAPGFAVSILLLILHCCAIESNELVSQ